MKKNTNNCFLLLLMVTMGIYLTNCSNDDHDTIENSINDGMEINMLQMRSITSSGSSELKDLNGIEVSIRLADTSRGPRYLSAHRSANSADLTSTDKDGWQRWNILSERRVSSTAATFDLKTISSPKNGSYLYIHDNWKYPSLLKNYAGSTPQWYIHNIEGTDLYRIGLLKYGVYYYLSAVNSSSGALCFESATSSNYKRQAWEIVPHEDFELISIEYDLATGAIRNEKINTYKNIPSVNNLPVEVNREFSINEKIITSSSFSKTEGLKLGVTASTGIKCGIPVINTEVTNRIDISSEKSWTYSSGRSETKEFSITDKYTFKQASNTSYIISIVGTEYTLDVKYKAVYRSKYGKIVKLNGQWNGVNVTDTKVILKDNTTGRIIATKMLTKR